MAIIIPAEVGGGGASEAEWVKEQSERERF